MHAQSSDSPAYVVGHAPSDDAIIGRALAILEARLQRGPALTAPDLVRQYLAVRAGSRPDQSREVFGVLWLDSQHRVIAAEDLFTGSLTSTSVYPRELMKAALAHQAAAVILTHNHPSGVLDPSNADIDLTKRLRAALDLIGVNVIDHFITAGGRALSMAEKGFM